MAEQFGDTPLAVLSEESQRTAGEDALSMNIEAGAAVAEAVRTTLGPRGMDKMLVSESGDVVVTNDGVTVLEEMDVDHPAAEMVVDVATTQEAAVGDGTTTAVVVAGALLEEASDLVERDVHPSTVVEGYRNAGRHLPGLLDAVTVKVSPDDTDLLESIAKTAMTGKGAEAAIETLAPLVVEAVRRTVEDGDPDPDAVKVHPFRGAPIADSRLVEGMLVDREPDHANMETDRQDQEVLLYTGELGLTESDMGAGVEVGGMGDLQAFVEREREELRAMVEGIVEAGVDVLFSTEAIDDEIQQQLATPGVLSVSNVREEDMAKLAAVTGGSQVSDFGRITADDIGYAGRTRQELIRAKYGPKSAAPEKSLVVDGVEEASAVTLILRGGTEHVVEEVQRAVEDAMDVVATTMQDGMVVPGGGATEVAVAAGLRDAADGVAGRQQLAYEAVADALETVPRTLAENGGLDTIDTLVDLRASHDGGATATGIDVHAGEVVDMHESGVVEPRRVKTQALVAGIDAVTSILRIDDVISAGELHTADDDEDGVDTPGGNLNPYA